MAIDRQRHFDRAVPLAVLALAGCCGIASCFLSGYDKVDGSGGSGGTGTTGSTSAVSAASTGAAQSSGASGGDELPRCETTDYPATPDDAPTTPAEDQWFAIRSVELGDPADPADVPGFDLDLVDSCNDTCRGIRPECTRPDFLADLEPEDEAKRCDWPEAVDNSTVHLFQAGELLGLTDGRLSSEADAGTWSLLIRVSGWNRTANDGQVTVSLYSTTGWEPPEGAGSSGAGSTGAGGADVPAPLWNGNDLWSIDSRSLTDAANLDAPAFRTTGGYVSDGTLVAELGGAFYVGSARVPLTIATGRLLAPLVLTEGQPPGLRAAVFAGRWRIQDLIPALGSLLIEGSPFCDEALFDGFVEGACRLVDVNGADQFGACDALSFGIRFDAGAMGPGAIVTVPGDPPACADLPTCETLLP